MIKRIIFLNLVLMVLFLPVYVYSDSKPKKQVLDFEDELVQGKASKPELFYLLQKKNFNYKKLIRLRENFIPEMKKTSQDLQRQPGSED